MARLRNRSQRLQAPYVMWTCGLDDMTIDLTVLSGGGIPLSRLAQLDSLKPSLDLPFMLGLSVPE